MLMKHITLLLVWCMLAAMPACAEPVQVDGVWYVTVDSTGTCRVVNGQERAYEGVVVIPAAIVVEGRSYAVTEIADTAFYQSGVTDLTLPGTLKRIGASAFSGCSHLETLHLESIDRWADVEFANAYSSPFAAQFYGKQKLWVGGELTDSVVFTKDVPDYACYHWKCIKKLRFADGVATIGREAFRECEYINTVYFGSGVQRIGPGAFMVCEWLRRVEVPTLAQWCAMSFADAGACPLSNSKVTAFVADGHEVTDMVIPDGCTSIGQFAFYAAPVLTSVEISDDVTSVGQYAFWGCANLQRVKTGNGLTTLSSAIFMDCKCLQEVDFGNSVAEIGTSVFSNCTALAELHLPSSLRRIGQTSFAFLTALKRLDVPEGVERIGQGAFSFCSSLEEVHLPSTLVDVGFGTFFESGNVQRVTVDRATAPEASALRLPFTAKVYAEAVLYVPQGAVPQYSTAVGWDKFSKIWEIGSSGLAAPVAAGSLAVSVQGGKVVVEAAAGTPWQIYDASGHRQASGAGPAAVSLRDGVYVVTVKGESRKVTVR